MPLASIGAGSSRQGNYCIFIVEKKQDDMTYKVLQSLLSNWLERQVSKPPLALKEKLNNVVELADSGAKRKRLEDAIASVVRLSNKKAKSKYGFSSAVAEVDEVLRELTATLESIEEIAHIKETALLRSLILTDYSDSDSSVDNSNRV